MANIITDEKTDSVCFSSHITKFKCWNELDSILENLDIPFTLIPHTEDIWVRDFMPVQIEERRYLLFDYHPGYLKNLPEYRTEWREYNFHRIRYKTADILQHPGKIIELSCHTEQHPKINLDGGNVIKCDDSVIVTDKVFSENRSISKSHLLGILENILECEVIIIPHDRMEETGHADGMVRYIGNKTVLLNHYADFDKALRKRLISALSPKFNIAELHYGTNSCPGTNWAYINYLQIGKHVIVPIFRNRIDEIAINQLEDILGKSVATVPLLGPVRIGGGLNCLSWTTKGSISGFISRPICGCI